MVSSARRMNHYEELGVSRSASIVDIRLAYKTLVRVLHPDQQQDENLRRMSELQLRRLNHILEVLSDPEERRRYDLGLERLLPVHRPPDAVPPKKGSLSEFRTARLRLQFNTGVLVWLLIAAIAIGSVVVWIRSPEPAPRITKTVREPSNAAPANVKSAQKLSQDSAGRSLPKSRPSGTEVVAQRPVELAPTVAKRSTLEPPPGQKQPVFESLPTAIHNEPPKKEIVIAAPNPELASAAPVLSSDSPNVVDTTSPAKASSSSISGKWLYVPKPDDNKNTLYPAEYIELRISSRAGLVRGRYRGKYRVNDRAISSEINFQFEGKQGESVSLLPWYSSNGSKGELRVKRLSDESIQVNWITTSFGTSNTLASGTAVLYRSDSP